MVNLFAEEATILQDFFSSIALKGAMTTELKSETGTVVDDVVLSISEDLVRCQMLDIHTRELVYLDISFVPSLPGEIKEENIIAVKDIKQLMSIVNLFNKGDTVYFDLNDDLLDIHNKDSVIHASVEISKPEDIIGYEKATFATMNLDLDVPKIDVPDGALEFTARKIVDLKSLRVIEKMAAALKTPIITVTWKDGNLLLSTSATGTKKTSGLKATGEATMVFKGGEWVKDTLINTANEYPIGLIPVLKELDSATMYARLDGNAVKQIAFKGERNRITKKYILGPAGKVDN